MFNLKYNFIMMYRNITMARVHYSFFIVGKNNYIIGLVGFVTKFGMLDYTGYYRFSIKV